MLKYQCTVENLKIKGELGTFEVFISAWWLVMDLICRKSVSKFSGLRWFFVFENLYNGEESLQANKTSKRH